MKTIIKIGILFLSAALQPLSAQSDSIGQNSPFSFQAAYIGEAAANFDGGLKKGSTYLGLANLKAGFDTELAKWWKDGSFFINIGNTHGGQPTENLVGDFQGVSNIEAGNQTFMYELWYRQKIGKFQLTAGLQDLNSDFAVSETATLFSNGSFGIHSCLADNVSSAIFPLTAIGFDFHWNISENYRWQTAIYDGTPDDFESNPYNLQWKLSKNQGYLIFSEFQIQKTLIANRSGSYKLGTYYHEHTERESKEKRNGGIYLVADQQLTNNLSVFSQAALSPKSLNQNNRYLSAGLSYKGLFAKRQNDLLGFAVAHAGMTDKNIGNETVLELTYNIALNKFISIRPDIQYIINPAGSEQNPDNALVGFIRFGINI